MRMLDLGPGTHWSWRVFTVRIRCVCFSKLVMCQIARPFVTVFDSAQGFVMQMSLCINITMVKSTATLVVLLISLTRLCPSTSGAVLEFLRP